MSGTVWSRFFWSDWENDSALRVCSLAAQGLWMRMLCVAAQHDPIGYVAVAGHGLEVPDLARISGEAESEVQTLLGELERNGVFSRDRQKRIYSRRMIRDAKRAAEARKNGKTGGNPSLSKNNGISPLDNPPVKAQDNPHIPLSSKEGRVSSSDFSSEKSSDAAARVIPFPAPTDGYAFAGRVIKLNQADFDRWRRAYSNIRDLASTLQSADDYYAQNLPADGKWFHRVSRWLDEENQRAAARRRVPDV